MEEDGKGSNLWTNEEKKNVRLIATPRHDAQTYIT